MFCKKGVLSISQNSSENIFVGLLYFSEVAGAGQVFSSKFCKKKLSRKSSIVDIGLGSKYTLASGRYWQEKLIVEKQFKKSLSLIWKRQEKNYCIQRHTLYFCSLYFVLITESKFSNFNIINITTFYLAIIVNNSCKFSKM